ncbi:hypothetical protein FO519_006339 [Halicephalobus sp. NKZ332]|nr:hypothetical protein FO519_006339 [Halicephalobus sp. NKZ332]
MQSPDEDEGTLLNLNVPSVFQNEDESESEVQSPSEGNAFVDDRTRSVSPPRTPRRQNSVLGGRSLGPSPTICQGSPFIYCGKNNMNNNMNNMNNNTNMNNNHRRIVQHNSMRATYSNSERERRREQGHSNGSRNGSRRLKRHDTDPSMEKRHSGRSKLSSPSNEMECYQDGYLNVPIMSRDRASPSVGSIQSDPESCLDGYFLDDDDNSLYVKRELKLKGYFPMLENLMEYGRIPKTILSS